MKKTFVVFSFLLLLIGCASQQDLQMLERNFVTLNARIDNLEKNQSLQKAKLKALEERLKDLEKTIGGFPSSQKNLLVKLGQLEEELKRLYGQVEYNQHYLDQIQTNFQKEKKETEDLNKQLFSLQATIGNDLKIQREKIKDLEKRLKILEDKITYLPTKEKKQQAESLYQNAFNLLRQEKYDQAKELFEKFCFQMIDKESIPNPKIWIDCIKCTHFPKCDEVALMLKI